jgi:hypothetical protein
VATISPGLLGILPVVGRPGRLSALGERPGRTVLDSSYCSTTNPKEVRMAEFVVNPHRFDPYKNFKFRVKWEGKYVAGVSSVSPLRRTTDVISYRTGSEPSLARKVPGRTNFDPITLERGVTHD